MFNRAADAQERKEGQNHERSRQYLAKKARAWLWLNCEGFHKGSEIHMLNFGYFKLGDVLNIAITRLGLSIGRVLVDDAIHIPLLELPSDSHNTASTMLDNG